MIEVFITFSNELGSSWWNAKFFSVIGPGGAESLSNHLPAYQAFVVSVEVLVVFRF